MELKPNPFGPLIALANLSASLSLRVCAGGWEGRAEPLCKRPQQHTDSSLPLPSTTGHIPESLPSPAKLFISVVP